MDNIELNETEHVEPLDKRETLDEIFKEQSTSNRKEMKKSTLIFIILTSVMGFLFLLFLILLLATRLDVFKVILIVFGAVGIAMAAILYKVVDWRMKHICPVCGAKRAREAEYIDTTEKITQFNSNNERWTKVSYTHIVKATYTCPKCGDTFICTERQNGGSVSESESGQILDKRREPRL